jgi:chromosome segregation ATPase
VLTVLRAEHSLQLEAVHAAIRHAEERAAVSAKQLAASQAALLAGQREGEALLRAADADNAVRDEALATCELLPSAADLEDETAALAAARDDVLASLAELQRGASAQRSVSVMRDELAAENAVLEGDVLAGKQRVRDGKETTRRLMVDVSLVLARRTRVAADVARLQAQERDAEAEADAIAAQIDELGADRRHLSARRQRLLVEGVVCDDLHREALIHDSIATSVAAAIADSVCVAAEAAAARGAALQKLQYEAYVRSMPGGTPRSIPGVTPRSL